MLFSWGMERSSYANDNSETWLQLSALTEKLLVKLNEKADEETGKERKTGNDDQSKSADRLEYVERRVRDIAAFERLFRDNGLRRN